MRLFIKTLPQFLLLTFGGAIVLLSLLSANRVFSQGVGFELAKQRFYFQADIMPDHLIYPAVVGVERLRLAFIDGNQEVNMRIGYAWKRLDHTQALLDRGYQGLSFTTLTKAHKYYLTALEQAQQLALTETQQQALAEDSQLFLTASYDLSSSFADDQREELKMLADQHQALAIFY